MPSPSLTEQEKIEAFCRELAQSLRQITGSQVAPSEEELASLAAQVTAKPTSAEAGGDSSSEAGRPSGTTTDSGPSQPTRLTRKPRTRQQTTQERQHTQRRRASR
jgi:hypothetical protein